MPECPIIGYYDKQRFLQFNPSDTANWYLVPSQFGKKKMAMYPTMGRRHLSYLEQNKLIFSNEPRGMFESVNFSYIVVDNSIFKIDQFFNQIDISGGAVTTFNTDIFFDYLVIPATTYAVFVDGQHIYVYDEVAEIFYTVTDANAPQEPTFVAAFGNRIVVSNANSSQFNLSDINLGGSPFEPSTCFTVPAMGGNAVFAQESGVIRQFAVLHNQLYIFTDFTTGIWANLPSNIPEVGGGFTQFPWKKNSTYDWDYGMADPKSLDTDFGRMVWMAKNRNGLVQVMVSYGDLPTRISTKAIDLLFQRNIRNGIIGDFSPFINGNADGFLYVWENTVFYRLSAGEYHDYGILDLNSQAHSIEYNFDTETWHRCIEKNGERNRIQKHIYYQNRHLVSVIGDTTVYEMSGQFYDNEISNPDRIDPQELDAYIREPFRYERVTPIIAEDDYAEFITDYVEIDFVWGEQTFIRDEGPFSNTQFLIAEEPGDDGEPVYLVAEDSDEEDPTFMIGEEGDTPTLNEPIYQDLYKPHIELYFSDDGGVTFLPADVLEFSQLGFYQWRMRWYQLGPSRNRCYKLICVSPAPIVVLGAVMVTRRSSGGAS